MPVEAEMQAVMALKYEQVIGLKASLDTVVTPWISQSGHWLTECLVIELAQTDTKNTPFLLQHCQCSASTGAMESHQAFQSNLIQSG